MKLKYVGRGDAFIGVPARDLTEEEITELSKEFDIQTLLKSGLYEAETVDPQDAEKVMPVVKKPKKERE